MVFALLLLCAGCRCDTGGEPLPSQSIKVREFAPRLTAKGWSMQAWMPANDLTTPTDVAIGNGTVYIAEAWDTLSGIVNEGERVRAANLIDDPATPVKEEKVRLHSIDVDPSGVIWGLYFPTGRLWRIKGYETKLFAFPQLVSTFESTVGVGVGGEVLVGLNRPDEKGVRSVLYRFLPDQVMLQKLGEYDQYIRGIAADHARHRTLMLLGRQLRCVDAENETTNRCGLDAPAMPSFNGIAVSPDGTIFVATGDWKDKGEVFRLKPGGTEWKSFFKTDAGLQGIGADSHYLYAVSRRQGSLFRYPYKDIGLGDVVAQKEFFPITGNGITIAQMLAWGKNPETGKHELYINDGESGRILAIDAITKTMRLVTEIVTYSHFGSKMTVDPATGDLLFPVNAPGFEKEHALWRIHPTSPATKNKILDGADRAGFEPGSALPIGNDELLISNMRENGEILLWDKNGAVSVFVNREQVPLLRYPKGMSGSRDELFVAVTQRNEFAVGGVPWSDTILRITRDGSKWRSQVVFEDKQGEPQMISINDFASDNQGRIYATVRTDLYCIAPPYDAPQVIAEDFYHALAAALDDTGRLYVSDGETSSIWQFTPPWVSTETGASK